jgi:protein PsiE
MVGFERNFDLPEPLRVVIFKIIDGAALVGLLTILAATLVAVFQEIVVISQHGAVRLADLLLLFIYMEIVAMVGIYFRSHRLPVRFPVMIAMVALARHIILEAGTMSESEILAIVGSIFILGVTATMLKYGNRFDVYEKNQQ